MRILFYTFVFLSLSLASQSTFGQKSPDKTETIPLVTSVCEILRDPSRFNNKLAEVRGYISANFETSSLVDDRCPEQAIWLIFADGNAPPQLEMTVSGNKHPITLDNTRSRTKPNSIHLRKDANFVELMRYLALSAEGEKCLEHPSPLQPPDCTVYRVTATFTGRLDTVSKRVHEEHLKQPASAMWRKGFGQMGMYEAQIVVGSVAQVASIDLSKK